MKPRHLNGTDCRSVTDILARIGDKWSVMVVMSLRDRTMRFSEIKRALHGISQKMLTVTLRGLERDGYVARTVYPTVPPKVEYKLTELGSELAAPVIALGDFAIRNRDRVLAARERFDRLADKPPAGVLPVPPARARRI